MDTPESDDDLHNPDPRKEKELDEAETIYSARGLANLGCLLLLLFCVMALLFVLLILPRVALHAQPVLAVLVRALGLTMNPKIPKNKTPHFQATRFSLASPM